MVQRFEIGAEVVKPSLFFKVSPTPSRTTTTTKWPFALRPNNRHRQREEGKTKRNCRRWSFELCEIAALNFTADLDGGATRHQSHDT